MLKQGSIWIALVASFITVVADDRASLLSGDQRALMIPFEMPLQLESSDVLLLFLQDDPNPILEDALVTSFIRLVLRAVDLDEDYYERILLISEMDELSRADDEYAKAKRTIGEDYLNGLRNLMREEDRWLLDQLRGRLLFRAVGRHQAEIVGALHSHPLDIAIAGLAMPPVEFRSISRAVAEQASDLHDAVEEIAAKLDDMEAVRRQISASTVDLERRVQRFMELLQELGSALERAGERAEVLAEAVRSNLPPQVRAVYLKDWQQSHHAEIYRVRRSEYIAEWALLDTPSSDKTFATLQALRAKYDPQLNTAREAAKEAKADMQTRAMRAMKMGLDLAFASPYYDALDAIDRIAIAYEGELRDVLSEEAYSQYLREIRRFERQRPSPYRHTMDPRAVCCVCVSRSGPDEDPVYMRAVSGPRESVLW